MPFELISFKLCPFVQRSVITLRHKGVDFETSYIELADPPAWFLEISPFKRVPLLRVDGETVLFESTVINEFLDEVTPGRLLPEDPLARAQARGWIEFGSACLWPCRDLTTAETAAAADRVVAELGRLLDRLEAALGDGPCFLGPDFSLVDAAFAPLFMRLAYFQPHLPILDSDRWPKLSAWSDHLLALPEVQTSVVPEFKTLMDDLVRKRQGYLATRLPGGGAASGEKQLY